jgi:hypothetical protein
VKCCYKVVVIWKAGDKTTYFCSTKEKDFLLQSLGHKYSVAAFAVPLEYTKTGVLSSA